MSAGQAIITSSNNLLVAICDKVNDACIEKDFFGTIVLVNEPQQHIECDHKTVYLCGDISKISDYGLRQSLNKAKRVFIIGDLSIGEHEERWPTVCSGRVPIMVHEAGVFYRKFFSEQDDYFEKISQEHVFQSLTESNKPGIANRTGIYLTKVEPDIDNNLHFRLLRCSTNLSGPTDNFRGTDLHIVESLNNETGEIFENSAELNHVLAQIYWNTEATSTDKMKKARISAHSDKTKDMPENGIMAFCTFYSDIEDKLKRSKYDPFDWQHVGRSGNYEKRTSGLTELHFRLKNIVAEKEGCDLKKEFKIKLYPNSVFFMPLSTNRLYTHEIQPPRLTAKQIPTRLGYVVRCSKTETVHVNDQTFVKQGEHIHPLIQRSEGGIRDLRKKYADENKLDSFIDYGNKFMFSMNNGDYIKPIY